uniref:Hint domain-containing protein n=1 Tax=Plectus sambesii TaxID=2011161 RepID=A0A914W2W2_9BILA
MEGRIFFFVTVVVVFLWGDHFVDEINGCIATVPMDEITTLAPTTAPCSNPPQCPSCLPSCASVNLCNLVAADFLSGPPPSPAASSEEGGANAHQHEDSEFNPSDETANRKDGFIRDNDAQRPRFRQKTAPRQKAICEDVASSLACTGLNQWVGGIGKNKDGSKPMKLQCCTYSGMAQSTVLGGTVIGENEALVGGEVLTNGRQTAFDVISNVQQIISPSRKVQYRVTTRRMPCPPDPEEEFNKVDSIIEQEIDSIISTPPEVPPAPQGPPQAPSFAQSVIGSAPAVLAPAPVFAPAVAAAPVAPVGAGLTSCFSADSLLVTKTGQTKRMDELKIGDEILSTAFGPQAVFVSVESFLHRIPHTKTQFVRIETSDGSVVKLTKQHIIFVIKGNKEKFLAAQDVKVGDQLLQRDIKAFSPILVTNLTMVDEIGAFAPMTSNGLLVVNGMVASCHSVNKMLSLQHTFLGFMRRLESFFSQWQQIFFDSDASVDNGFVDVPTGTWQLLSVLEYIIPISPLMSWI